MQDNDAPPLVGAEAHDVTARTRKYHQAAVGYFVYGLVYLGGAVYLSTRNEGPDEWTWFAVGAGMVLLFPVLIWREMKWVSRILAVLVAVRILGLIRLVVEGGDRMIAIPGGSEMPILYGAFAFLVIAGIECLLLTRAGWDI